MNPHLFLFPLAVRQDPAIERWMDENAGELGRTARFWIGVLRGCGDDVRELMHDGRPTFCVGEAAFAYVDSFRDHVNVGFFRGAELPDSRRLLEGTGRMMRHVKLRPASPIDEETLAELIALAYEEMKVLLEGSSG